MLDLKRIQKVALRIIVKDEYVHNNASAQNIKWKKFFSVSEFCKMWEAFEHSGPHNICGTSTIVATITTILATITTNVATWILEKNNCSQELQT